MILLNANVNPIIYLYLMHHNEAKKDRPIPSGGGPSGGGPSDPGSNHINTLINGMKRMKRIKLRSK